ncbi:2'-5' RNA ligase family protein [Candidatus Dojkabacteria bacterium]|nr:2'-5' RNA ligase family protein [Candidatus Dojkabacteria bacterium]
MEEEFIRLNIAFKVPAEVRKYVISLSKDIIKGEKTHYVLDGKRYIPHLTIYSPEFPRERLEDIYGVLERIATNAHTLEFHFQKIDTGDAYIGAEFECTEQIMQFHRQIVRELSPLREGHLRPKYKDPKYLSTLTKEHVENIKNYGYPRVMKLYRPHLSFIRFEDEDVAKKIAEKINWNIHEFTVEEVGVYTMGEHGTCKDELRSFFLGKG